MDTPHTDLTPRQRSQHLAKCAGVPDALRDAYAPEIERLARLAAAERRDSLDVIEHRTQSTHMLVSVAVAICGASFALDLIRAVGSAI